MRGDHRDDTSRSKQEISAAGLLEGIRRLFPDLVRVAINERPLSHAAAGNAGEMLARR